MNRIFSLVFLLAATPLYGISKPIPALCIIPVADLLSQKFSPLGNQTMSEKYAVLPLSEKQPASLCCRTTQLLFNEQVTIIEQSNGQSFVETVFWHLKQGSPYSPSTRNNRFWTLTKNLRHLSVVPAEALATIPPTDSEKSLEKIVTLTLPWHCPETATTYSAGTQFVHTGLDDEQYRITLYNPDSPTPVQSTVPKNLCVLNKKRSDLQKRELFLSTVQGWARGIPESIPYVLGGASIIETFKAKAPFYEKKMTLGKTKGTVFMRSECTATPHTGVDCAGLIRLACKIAGIPLTATNSKSIAQSFYKLAPTAKPQNGDLLFWKGHAAIISDVENGLLIEARGYEHGYGLVQEIPYSRELRSIDTTDKLMNVYLRKKPIQRLDIKGQYRETILDLTVLSLLPVKTTPWMK